MGSLSSPLKDEGKLFAKIYSWCFSPHMIVTFVSSRRRRERTPPCRWCPPSPLSTCYSPRWSSSLATWAGKKWFHKNPFPLFLFSSPDFPAAPDHFALLRIKTKQLLELVFYKAGDGNIVKCWGIYPTFTRLRISYILLLKSVSLYS